MIGRLVIAEEDLELIFFFPPCWDYRCVCSHHWVGDCILGLIYARQAFYQVKSVYSKTH